MKQIDSSKRQALVKLMISEDFLTREEGWAYDPSSKKQLIVAEA